jgi:3-polyprenyl-4-hydroxybenzoate decarboxylase
VDVYREQEVLWAIATRMQADRDVTIIPNAMGAILDPSTRAGTTAKMVIDATRPVGGFARRHTLPEDAVARAADLIARLGRE